MEISAHYYAVLALCRACNFNKQASHSIAYASQFVDDAIINHITVSNPSIHIPFEVINGEKSLYNMATCHNYFKLETFNYTSMISNTTAFHFAPGCEGSSFTKKMRSKQNSKVIADIINRVLGQDDLIKLGIALHVLADSYSHQGFSGILSEENNIRELKNYIEIPWDSIEFLFNFIRFFTVRKTEFDKFFDSVTPCYGHAQAITYPDEPCMEWSYEYDGCNNIQGSFSFSGRIDNKIRYINAFVEIKKNLETFLEKNTQYMDNSLWSENISHFISEPDFNRSNFSKILTYKCSPRRRINKWKKAMIKYQLFDVDDPMLKYDKNFWVREAFENFNEKKFNARKVDDVELSNNFLETSWWKFHNAVSWYKKCFLSTCREFGLDIQL